MERFLSPKQVAEYLRVSRATIYRLMAMGSIKRTRVGGSLRIDVMDLLNVEKNSVSGEGIGFQIRRFGQKLP